jgi:hypothetical protein
MLLVGGSHLYATHKIRTDNWATLAAGYRLNELPRDHGSTVFPIIQRKHPNVTDISRISLVNADVWSWPTECHGETENYNILKSLYSAFWREIEPRNNKVQNRGAP